MSVAPPPSDDLPARHPWEEPPVDGWSSSLPDLGKELGLFAVSAALLFGAIKVVHRARLLGEHEQHGFAFALLVALWLIVCMITATILVYVWRRLGGLALVAAMLTDYGRLARMGGRPPVWLDSPPAGGLRIAHLSDLHVNEGDSVRMVERAHPGGNRQLDRVLDAPPLGDADVILVTGDVTDRGTAASWRNFLDALDERELSERVVLVPGNHDIAFVDHIVRKRALRLDRFAIVQLSNLLKFGEAFAETMGGQRGVCFIDGEPRSYLDAWSEAEKAVRPLVAALPTTPVPPMTLGGWWRERHAFFDYVDKIEAARAKLLELFPVAIPLSEHDSVIFVLNSVSRVSRHPALNAIGRIGRAQYKRLDRLARQFPQRIKLVAVHHHLVRRGEEQSARFLLRLFAKFTVLGDSRPLVKFCIRWGVRAVLNGHRHLSYQLRLPSGTVLLAAPSSTLGDELAHDPRPQFERYDFSPKPDEDTVGIFRAAIRLPRDPTPPPPPTTTSPPT
ncbi:MAG: metallophosphoesterase [bacterium]|nr:metallophosphoesterase [bacterium]